MSHERHHSGAFLFALLTLTVGTSAQAIAQTRARALGVAPGVFAPGVNNAITDVEGVRVGHTTIIEGDSVRTGITAILPHAGNAYLERVPAAVWVGNGFGKLLGSTQVNELGELESPILLTCTLCVWRAADALVEWMLAEPRMERVRSLNPLVAETNDGRLNPAIRSRPITPAHVRAALTAAAGGPVVEGSVGAGTGTSAFGWKGGIGTSSRKLPSQYGGHTVGVLVQTNFGGVLSIAGVPVGRALGRDAYRSPTAPDSGSVIVVIATDAPLSDRNLRRLASRAMMGLGRTGSSASNGSGDYVIAFSTALSVRRQFGATSMTTTELGNETVSSLFQAVVEATEEAVYNSLFAATTVTSRGGTVEALPIARVRPLLEAAGIRAR
ncbi:MAG TPA: P1 family peptidase [Gemmatimonadaceae bacterium]|nr:P1 family peptidase [Gemmatimonadaceae bacterium]